MNCIRFQRVINSFVLEYMSHVLYAANLCWVENLLEIYQALAVNPCLIVFAEVAEEGLVFVSFAMSLSEEVSPKLYDILHIFLI